MRSFIAILVVALLAGGCANKTRSNLKSPAKSASLFEYNSSDFGDTHYLIRIVELERNVKTSKLKLTCETWLPPTAGIMWTMRGIFEIAKVRGFEYFINLKEWDDDDGGHFYIIGFTNKVGPNIHDEFGDEFTLTNEYRQPRGFFSVSDCRSIFEPK